MIRDVIDDTHLRRTRRYLDRHRPLQIAVGRAIDIAYAAGADLRRARGLAAGFRREELVGRSARVSFRVSLHRQNRKTEANKRQPTKESEDANSLTSCELC